MPANPSPIPTRFHLFPPLHPHTDTYRSSRMDRETSAFESAFGGLPRTEATIHTTNDGNMAKKLRSVLCPRPLLGAARRSHIHADISRLFTFNLASLFLSHLFTSPFFSLRAIRDVLTPVYKHDETSKCSLWDNVENAAPAECSDAPYNTTALYCTCSEAAASPDEVTITWPGQDSVSLSPDLPGPITI